MWNCESCVILHTEVSYYVGWYGLLESSPILYTNDLPSVWAYSQIPISFQKSSICE